MRRIALWALATLSVLVLLFGYHTSTQGGLATAAPPAIVSTPTAGSSESSAESSAESSDESSGESSRGSTSAGGQTSSGSSSGSTDNASRTVEGPVVQTQWGPVQVELTVQSGSITAVQVPTYPNGNPRDAEINASALPQLVNETLDAQSAQIDVVSGATVTSDGYLTSLQGAIDQAGL